MDSKKSNRVEIKERKISMNLQSKMMEIVTKLRGEMEKRDKILDRLVSGGDVTLVDVDVDSQTSDENDRDKDKNSAVKSGTKTFEMLIKTIPYKIERVTLNHINWDELVNSFENERGEISLFSQDVKPKSKQGSEKESLPKPKSTDGNVNQKIPPCPAKRRLSKIESESDEIATTICENQNQNQPKQKQPKLEEKDFDFVCELPEYSMDKSFFETKDTSTTTSKFLIRLHDNNTEQICVYDISHSRRRKWTGSQIQKLELNLEEITAAINVQNGSNPGSKLKIWCDVKHFDFLSSSNFSVAQSRDFFESFGTFISHFSFHHHSSKTPNSSSSLLNSNFLIGFILQNFPNLEFLSINSETLSNLDDLKLNLNLLPSLKFDCLKTLKILQSKMNRARISSTFLAKLLKRAPLLESLYEIPLQCVKETAELDKILMEDSLIEHSQKWNSIDESKPKLKIRSVFIQREIYFNQPHKFLDDLLDLYNLDTGTKTGSGRIILALEEFRAQRYFIQDPALREKVGQIMSRILQMNRESLIKLTLEPNRNPKIAMKIPRLENLKILRFEFGRANFPSFFPRGFQQNDIFPKLEQVEIYLMPTPKQTPQKRARNPNFRSQNPQPESKSRISADFLRCAETFESVQSLLLKEITPPISAGILIGSGSGSAGLLKMRSMFPNLTKLQLNNSLYEISLCLQQVFQHFPHLQQLILEMDTDSRHGNLDAGLTGIKMDFCKKLEKFVPCPVEGNGKEKMLQIIRNGRSLSDLKELRVLKFILRSGITRELNKIPTFTPVSFEYGLGPEQLKNVKIFLDFHEKTSQEVKSDILTALGPVLPFITIL